MKIPVAQQPAYTIYFERFKEMTWTHADVHKWTPEIKREFVQVHTLLQMMHTEPFYCLTDNPKLEKFVRSIGYTFIQELTFDDGTKRNMWRYINGRVN